MSAVGQTTGSQGEMVLPKVGGTWVDSRRKILKGVFRVEEEGE